MFQVPHIPDTTAGLCACLIYQFQDSIQWRLCLHRRLTRTLVRCAHSSNTDSRLGDVSVRFRCVCMRFAGTASSPASNINHGNGASRWVWWALPFFAFYVVKIFSHLFVIRPWVLLACVSSAFWLVSPVGVNPTIFSSHVSHSHLTFVAYTRCFSLFITVRREAISIGILFSSCFVAPTLSSPIFFSGLELLRQHELSLIASQYAHACESVNLT